MADPQRFDTVLKAAIIVLIVVIVGFGAWFGWSVYADRKAAEEATPAFRTLKVVRAQVAGNPNDADLRVRLGEAYAAAGESQQAIEQFNAALKINPKHFGAYLDLGLLAMDSKRLDEARGYLQKVIDLTTAQQTAGTNDRGEIAYYNLGRIELADGNYDKAIGYFNQSLRIRSDASDTYYYLAMALDSTGQHDEAKRNLGYALRFDPSFSQAHLLLGKIYLDAGQKVLAAAEIGQSLALSPDSPEPKALAAQIGDPATYAAQAAAAYPADPKAALDAASIAFSLDPADNIASGKLKAKILLQQGHKQLALATYQALAQVAPKDAAVLAAVKKLTAKPKAKSSSKK